jgi:hypothetical protein
MAVRVRVQNRFQIIVPVRVDRAVRGAPVIDAPDVDDRGFVNNRAVGLNVDDARGALFGMTLGDTVRVRVVREDLDDGAPLFVTAGTSGAPQVQIAQPPGGGPLAADGVFSVRAIADTLAGQKLEIRMGSTIGPVIAEADPHVFSPLTLNITPHVCSIHQSAAPAAGRRDPRIGGNTLDATQLDALFEIIRAIWRAAGVQFNIGAIREETFTGFTRDDFASRQPPGGGASEEDTVISRNPAANTCNIYFVRNMDRSLGVGVNFESRAGEGLSRSGIIIGVEGSSSDVAGTTITGRSSAGADLIHEIGNDVAHEIGHFLTLSHADRVDSPGLRDTYGRRHLMHPNNLLPQAVTGAGASATSVPRFDDIGYGVGGGGAGHRGCLITLKDHPTHRTDGETVQARRRFRSPNLFR